MADNMKKDSRVPATLTGIHREKYLEKLEVLHQGACTSPYAENCGEKCPCPMLCPLHGRCCDCLTHHKVERLKAEQEGRAKAGEMDWVPNCLKWFDQLNGIQCEGNPNAAREFFETTFPETPLR